MYLVITRFITVEAQVATSLTILGAWIGSLISGGPSQQYGKRMTLLCNAAFFIVGAALSASGDLYALFIGRLISGIYLCSPGFSSFCIADD
jgi:predicted MFS family arabinose efflux permease